MTDNGGMALSTSPLDRGGAMADTGTEPLGGHEQMIVDMVDDARSEEDESNDDDDVIAVYSGQEARPQGRVPSSGSSRPHHTRRKQWPMSQAELSSELRWAMGRVRRKRRAANEESGQGGEDGASTGSTAQSALVCCVQAAMRGMTKAWVV